MREIYVLVGDPAEDHGQLRLASELRDRGATNMHILPLAQRCRHDNAFLLVMDRSPPSWALELEATERSQVLGCTFVLNGPTAPSILELLEEYGLAGGIENRRFDLWRQRASDNGYGIVGRRDAVEKLGVRCASNAFTSKHYCTYGSVTKDSLVSALWEYLQALDAISVSS